MKQLSTVGHLEDQGEVQQADVCIIICIYSTDIYEMQASLNLTKKRSSMVCINILFNYVSVHYYEIQKASTQPLRSSSSGDSDQSKNVDQQSPKKRKK